MDIVPLDPAGNRSRPWVAHVGHHGGAGNGELEPRRERTLALALRNGDLDPPLILHVPRPRIRVDGEPPELLGTGPCRFAVYGDQVPVGSALVIGQWLVSVPLWVADLPCADFTAARAEWE